MHDDRRLVVVTGFSKDGYEVYGKQFLDSFAKHVQPGIDLVAYVAEPVPMPVGRFVLHSELDGVHEFVEQNKNIPEHCGKAPVRGWRKKDERAGYSYRYDAVKFCWQLFYPEHAAQNLRDGDVLVWFDGDVVFHAPIDTSFIESNMGNADLIYLGRRTHTELGFWAIRMTPVTSGFLNFIKFQYTSGHIFNIPEWHSAAVFDWCREHSAVAILSKNLTGDDAGNVWERTPLRRFSTHLKGKLKDQPLQDPGQKAPW